MPLISSEFLFIIASLVISVNLINIVRPMPIWWDDLGVYMNYARLITWAWELLPLGSMFSWQIFTGIWYMFNSATQAFFLNNVWGVLSFIVLGLVFSDLLKSSKRQFYKYTPTTCNDFFIYAYDYFSASKRYETRPLDYFL